MKDLPEDHPIRRIWEDGRKTKQDLAEQGDSIGFVLPAMAVSHVGTGN